MIRKLVFVLIALVLPFAAAQAASAQQYPPTGEGGTTVPQEQSAPPAPGAEAPLPRTGSDVAVLGGVAVVLLAGGAVVVVASRRRALATVRP